MYALQCSIKNTWNPMPSMFTAAILGKGLRYYVFFIIKYRFSIRKKNYFYKIKFLNGSMRLIKAF